MEAVAGAGDLTERAEAGEEEGTPEERRERPPDRGVTPPLDEDAGDLIFSVSVNGTSEAGAEDSEDSVLAAASPSLFTGCSASSAAAFFPDRLRFDALGSGSLVGCELAGVAGAGSSVLFRFPLRGVRATGPGVETAGAAVSASGAAERRRRPDTGVTGGLDVDEGAASVGRSDLAWEAGEREREAEETAAGVEARVDRVEVEGVEGASEAREDWRRALIRGNGKTEKKTEQE